MKRHTFDPLSFVFGVILLLIAAASTLDQSVRWDLNAWVVPAAALVLGIGLLASALRSTGQKPRVDTDPLPSGTPVEASEDAD